MTRLETAKQCAAARYLPIHREANHDENQKSNAYVVGFCDGFEHRHKVIIDWIEKNKLCCWCTDSPNNCVCEPRCWHINADNFTKFLDEL